MKELKVGIIGVPFDYGIELIGGRPGARFAPGKTKKEFFKLIKKSHFQNLKIINYGNVISIKNDSKKTHKKVTNVVKKIISKNAIPIVIGGGHDISFGSGKALYLKYKKIGGINFDAHYDVRPVIRGKITSGTPFRRLLDHKFLIGKNFVELGLHSPKNLIEHENYLLNKKSALLKLNYINKIGLEKALKKAFLIASKKTNAVMFDIDIDGVQKRFAPGCSAPCEKGFTKSQILKSAYLAGKNKMVKLFNLMEVSPPLDVKNKTVKLAAELILSFIKGLKERNRHGN